MKKEQLENTLSEIVDVLVMYYSRMRAHYDSEKERFPAELCDEVLDVLVDIQECFENDCM